MIQAPRLAALAASTLLLGGCISLFPRNAPVDLYRFASAPAAGPVADPGPRAVSVLLNNGTFDRAAAGDRLVAVQGDRVSYIANARWATPADTQFKAAVLQAFDALPGPARLLQRGDPGRAAYGLRLDVDRFEAAYLDGPAAAPTVVVAVHARLVRLEDASVVAVRDFETRVPARANRLSAFVPAYGAAAHAAAGDLAAWVDSCVVAVR